MTTYARVVDGLAVDVVVTPPELADRFNPEWLAKQEFVEAPDDTVHGRAVTQNPDGSLVWGDNPQPPPPAPPIYKDLTEIEFIVLCQDAGGMTDDMLVACRADAACAALWIKFQAAPFLARANKMVQDGISRLASFGYLPNGAAAVNAYWPVV